MRIACLVTSLFLVMACGEARADPPPETFGTDVQAALRQMQSGKTAEGQARLLGLARSGRADAAFAIGTVTLTGMFGIRADPKAACDYFELGSKGRGDAMHNLALCHEQGTRTGVPDLAKAAAFYRQAVDLGYAKAKCALGNFYIHGRGVPRDGPRGLKLCQEAAEVGFADAQTDVGNVYLAGEVVPRDAVEARRWYEKAAAQKQANAAYTLGGMYWNGDGVGRDLSIATKYWRIAYDAGRLDAAAPLGDEAFMRAKSGEKTWHVSGLDEAAGWYAKAKASPVAAVRAQASDREALMAQLKDAMLRQRAR